MLLARISTSNSAFTVCRHSLHSAAARRLQGRSTSTPASATPAMEKVTFGAGLPGYEVGPKTSPAVIVLQEWWGVTDIIKEQAVMLSAAGGFRCLIPDLYKGKLGVDAEEASHLMSNLDFKAAVAEVAEAATYLRSTGSPAVGVTGFCMGGALSFAAAQHVGVPAAPFYGIPDAAICDPAAIKVPVQAHFGQLDTLQGFSDPASIQAVVEKMQGAGVPVELFMYAHSGHAFMNALTEAGRAKIKEIGQAEPPAEEPQQAFERLVAFFKQHLSAAA